MVLAGILIGCGNETSVGPTASDHFLTPAAAPGESQSLTFVVVGRGLSGETPLISVFVRAEEGATLRVGRHTLVIPPRALAEDTEISMADLSPGTGRVECLLLPEGLNFRRPVSLTTSFSDLTDPGGFRMYWLSSENANGEVWTFVPSQETPDGSGVRATLHHFSRYAPGKAGW